MRGQPIVKVSDISRIRPRPEANLPEAEVRARETVQRLLRAIDDRDAQTFANLVIPSADSAAKPSDPDVLNAQLEYLHVKYGGRPRRIVRAAPGFTPGNPALTPYFVGVLFGDHEDLLTIDVMDATVLAFHEDDPSTIVEPDGGGAPAK